MAVVEHPGQAVSPMFEPIVHVHVSGSAGTTMCNLARWQGYHPAGGNAYNCIAPSKGQATWRLATLEPSASFLDNMRSRYATCEDMRHTLERKGYAVIAEIESFLPSFVQNVSDQTRNASAFLRSMNLSGCSSTADLKANRMSMCNRPPIRCMSSPCPEAGRPGHLAVEPGAPSPIEPLLEGLWPAARVGGGIVTTYCSNMRFTFLMNDPAGRVVSHLALQCHDNKPGRCEAWATEMLVYVYSKDLVLDAADGQSAIGTPFMSNCNIRWLLGARVFFSRLRGILKHHVEKAVDLLGRFTFVAPVKALANASSFLQLLRQQLGWPQIARLPVANKHPNNKKITEAVLSNATVADLITEHNKRDIHLYQWVCTRYKGLLAAQESLEP